MKSLGIAYQIKNRSKRGEMRKVSDESDRPDSQSGLMDPKSMASMIMAKKMAKGGMVEEEMPMAPMDEMDEDESLPLDHATEHDEFLTAEGDDEFTKKKPDLISRVMMMLK